MSHDLTRDQRKKLEDFVEYESFPLMIAKKVVEGFGVRIEPNKTRIEALSQIEIPNPIKSVDTEEIGQILVDLSQYSGYLDILVSSARTNELYVQEKIKSLVRKKLQSLSGEKLSVSDKKQLAESGDDYEEECGRLSVLSAIRLRLEAILGQVDKQYAAVSRELSARKRPNE